MLEGLTSDITHLLFNPPLEILATPTPFYSNSEIELSTEGSSWLLDGRFGLLARKLGLFFRAIDAFLVLWALWLGTRLRGIALHFDYLVAGVVGDLCFAMISGATALYGTWRLGLLHQELRQVWMNWVWTCGIL